MKETALRQLLSLMSLREKIGQMIQLTGTYYDEKAVLTGEVGEELPPEWVISYAGSVLGVIGADKIRMIQETYMQAHPHCIPLLFMADVIHGCRTIFPIPLGQACSFHPKLVRDAAAYAAKEASSEGIKATFSPVVDVSKDPRWGRIMESFGEDPVLNGIMGTAMLEGYQDGEGRTQEPFKDDSIEESQIAGCLKHFAGYGAVNGGREYNDVELSYRTFREQYIKPFQMAVHANPAMVMTAFHAIDRRPVSGNKELLENVLRKKLEFDGVIISDWGSIGQLEEQRVVSGQEEAAYKAVEAGLDIDMMSPAYMFHLERLVEQGKISEERINESAFKVLQMKNRLGLFENPYAGLERNQALSPQAKACAFRLACESCVLLENKSILPLDPAKKVYWIGPYVNTKEFLSRWAIFGRHSDVETIEMVLAKQGIQAECIPGCEMLTETEQRIWQVGEIGDARNGENSSDRMQDGWLEEIGEEDTVVLVLGEHEAQSGEAASRAFLDLPQKQMELFDMVSKRTDRIVSVIISGRPLDLRKIVEKSRGVIFAFRPGTMGAEAITSLVYGSENPSGKLSVSMPWCVGQVPVSYWDMTTGHQISENGPDHRFSSRYMDIPNHPLYPFGYGLSYTEFKISDFEIYKEMAEEKESVRISCSVKNIGTRSGAEVVQYYVETLAAAVVRPAKELIRFQKVFLEPGEKKNVCFVIDRKEFMFYGENMELVDGGIRFRIIIGNSSRSEAGSFELCF